MADSRNESILKSILAGKKYEQLPQSRIEALLIQVGDLIRSGGATPEQIEAAVDDYLATHPVQPGELDATTAEQILQDVYKEV